MPSAIVEKSRRRVVVLGGGFGGIRSAHKLKGAAADVVAHGRAHRISASGDED
jgi:NADH dehydrogenase FAD-containing subunit